jgi:hypothetical protein
VLAAGEAKAGQSNPMGSFCLGYPTREGARAKSRQQKGHFDNLQSCAAAYFDLTEVADFIASDYRDGGLVFFEEEDKKNTRDNVRGVNDASKFQSMAAHVLHLGYELAIAPSSNAFIVPWLHAAMTETTTGPSKGALPLANTAGDAESLLALDTATSC